MSVVDLTKRVTQDSEKYRACVRSADSLILIRGKVLVDPEEPASIDLTIGTLWHDSRQRRDSRFQTRAWN